jgi:hypothetical protein
MWASLVSVYDLFSLPIGYFPEMRPDGAGGRGALLAPQRRLALQRIRPAPRHERRRAAAARGRRRLHHGGMHHISPSSAYDPPRARSRLLERAQQPPSQWGIYAQKITSAGARAWGEAGCR